MSGFKTIEEAVTWAAKRPPEPLQIRKRKDGTGGFQLIRPGYEDHYDRNFVTVAYITIGRELVLAEQPESVECGGDAPPVIVSGHAEEEGMLTPTDGEINDITLRALGKWPSFEAQSWACKVVHAVIAALDLKSNTPSDYPLCSGDPASCPENEGHGCCKPNPSSTPAKTLEDFIGPSSEATTAQKKIADTVDKITSEVHSQREEILRAFVAKYGCQPNEVVQVVNGTLGGPDFTWWVEYIGAREPGPEALRAKITDFHLDDIAVDRFAAAMKAKLAVARSKGRDGWRDKDDCSQQTLSDMLRHHVDKGDPVDVANFCCFHWNRDEGIAPAPPASENEKLIAVIRRIKLRLHFMGWPAESMWNAGTDEEPQWIPDWRYEIALIENALHGTPITMPEKPTDTTPYNQIKIAQESLPDFLDRIAAELERRDDHPVHGLGSGLAQSMRGRAIILREVAAKRQEK